jgi:hypothetical protein
MNPSDLTNPVPWPATEPTSPAPHQTDTAVDPPPVPAVEPAAASPPEAPAAPPTPAPQAPALPDPAVDFNPADAPPDDSFGDILSEFEQSHQAPGKGSLITGTVVSITDEWVFVDLGRKNDGVVPSEKFRDASGQMTVQKGTELTLTITSRDEHGIYLLDTLMAQAPPKDWSALEDAFSENRIVRARVLEAVKGGLRVDVGMRGFLDPSAASPSTAPLSTSAASMACCTSVT